MGTSEDISESTTINLITVRNFKIEPTDDVSIDRVYDVAAFNHQQDKIAWINGDKNQVFVTDLNGNHLFNFGSTGRGPEEFLGVFSIGFDPHDNVVVYDAKLDLFKKFKSPGVLMDTYAGIRDDNIFTYSRKLLFSDDYLYISVMEMDKANKKNFWKSRTTAKLDQNYKLVELSGSYDPELTEATFLYKYPMITFDPKHDVLYTTHRTLAFIQAYNINETNINHDRFGINSASFRNTEEEATQNDPIHIRRQKNLGQSFVEESFVSNDYFFLQHSAYSEDVITYGDTFLRQSFFNIFEKNGPYRFLGEVKLESIPLHVTKENKIYVLQDNNPDNFTLKVYDLVINK